MEKIKYEVKEREQGMKIEIITPDGNTFRITAWDHSNQLTIQTVDGTMRIFPSVTNEIRIETNPSI